MIVAGMLGHSLAILLTTYAHLARFTRYASYIPGTQDEAACLMDDIISRSTSETWSEQLYTHYP
jgi:hypothetical protein